MDSSLNQLFKVSMTALCDGVSQVLKSTLEPDLMRIDCSLITVNLWSDSSSLVAGVCLSGSDKAAELLAPGCKNEKIPSWPEESGGTGDVAGLVRREGKVEFGCIVGGKKKIFGTLTLLGLWGFFWICFQFKYSWFVHSANFCEWVRNVLVGGINICTLMLCWQW